MCVTKATFPKAFNRHQCWLVSDSFCEHIKNSNESKKIIGIGLYGVDKNQSISAGSQFRDVRLFISIYYIFMLK